MTLQPGARTRHWLTLDVEAIRAGAAMVGDFNPLHHDADYAARSRFGALFASGAHTAALLAGMVSKGWERPDGATGPAVGADDGDGPSSGYVGVEYSVKFLAPARVDRRLRFEWEVIAIEPKSRGHLARLEGRIVDEVDDVVVLTGAMAMLSFGP